MERKERERWRAKRGMKRLRNATSETSSKEHVRDSVAQEVGTVEHIKHSVCHDHDTTHCTGQGKGASQKEGGIFETLHGSTRVRVDVSRRHLENQPPLATQMVPGLEMCGKEKATRGVVGRQCDHVGGMSLWGKQLHASASAAVSICLCLSWVQASAHPRDTHTNKQTHTHTNTHTCSASDVNTSLSPSSWSRPWRTSPCQAPHDLLMVGARGGRGGRRSRPEPVTVARCKSRGFLCVAELLKVVFSSVNTG